MTVVKVGNATESFSTIEYVILLQGKDGNTVELRMIGIHEISAKTEKGRCRRWHQCLKALQLRA